MDDNQLGEIASTTADVLSGGLVTKAKIGCFIIIFVLTLVVIIFLANVQNAGADEINTNGLGGPAAGSCMDIENGTALSSEEIGTLLNKISQAKLLRGGEKTIYDEAKEAKINPLWSFGQAKHESQFGQAYANNPSSKYGRGKNMFGMDYSTKYKSEHMASPAWVWGGASGHHKVAQFKKWEFGLSEHMRLIRRAYLNPGGFAERSGKKVKNMTNEEKALAILHTYAPHSDGNNPDDYAKSVLKSMEGWCKDLGIDPNTPR